MTKEQRQIINKAMDTINKKTFCVNYHVIKPTVDFQGTSDVGFFAYDDVGDIAYFYINFDKRLARYQYVGLENAYDKHDISEWFFN